MAINIIQVIPLICTSRIIDELKKEAMPVIHMKEIKVNNQCASTPTSLTSLSQSKVHKISAGFSNRHPAYEKLAAKLALKELYSETPDTFEESLNLLQHAVPPILKQTYIQNAKSLIKSGFLDGFLMPQRDEELS
ncbi:hypothetical protein CVT26_013565 [Gymnopilus dilepis]|uniref:Uncharacterized protein n=1 Tax=Gymnopilus dilepis TaxID=231916 RepID=A0A409X5I4_9AGAR|nr:hypothetical protein CVT26_013565 [Gymnopilus dilepis]